MIMRQIGKCIRAAFVLFFLVALGNVYAGGRPFITRWEGKAGEALKIPICLILKKVDSKNRRIFRDAAT